VNFAAESHVDRGITNREYLWETNVVGTQVLLDATKKYKLKKKFVQVSTDEVYGSLGSTGLFTEGLHLHRMVRIRQVKLVEILLVPGIP